VSKRRQIEEEPLNLVPIMNLVTILIPFLLAAIKSFELSVIDTTVPSISNNANQPQTTEDEDKPIMLKLGISDKGLRIMGADEQLGIAKPEEGAEPLPGEKKQEGLLLECENQVCSAIGSYPWAELRKNLLTIKGDPGDTNTKGIWCTGKDTDTIILAPNPEIKYEILVVAMDVSRSDHIIKNKNFEVEQQKAASPEYNVVLNPEKKGSDRCEKVAKKSGDVAAVDKPLFPKVVMAADVKQVGGK
jgi:hypothetical protein